MLLTKELLIQLHVGAVLFVLYLGLPIAALLLIPLLLERFSLGEEAYPVQQPAHVEVPAQDEPEPSQRTQAKAA